MPFYDYVCSSCGHEVEVMHSVHATGPSVCPNCRGDMKKALVAPAVHFKGSGWARKERSGGGRAEKGSSKGSASDSNSGSESSSGDSGKKPDVAPVTDSSSADSSAASSAS